MPRGINKVIFIGNLGADPQVAFTKANETVATISLATSRQWTDKESGEARSHTEWHRVVFFKKLADIAAQYLKKGAKIYVEGELRTRKWTDNNNIDRYVTEVVARELAMLDKAEKINPPPPEASEPAGTPVKTHNQATQPEPGNDLTASTDAESMLPMMDAPPLDEGFDGEVPF